MLASPGVAAYFGGRREAKEMLSKGMGHTFRVGEEDYSVASEVTTRFQESAYEKMQNWFLQAAGLAGDGGPLETFLLLANERIMSLVDLARSNSKSTEDDASLQQAKGDEGDEGETSDGSDTEDDGLGPYLGQFAHPLPFQLAHPPPDYSYTRPAAKRRKAPGLADIYQKVHAQKKPGEAEIVYQKAHKRPKAKAGLAEIYQQAHATKAGKSGANAGDKQSRDDLQHLVILAAQAANAAAEVPGPPPQKASAPRPPPAEVPAASGGNKAVLALRPRNHGLAPQPSPIAGVEAVVAARKGGQGEHKLKVYWAGRARSCTSYIHLSDVVPAKQGGALPRALVSMVEQALENQIEAGGGRSREQQKKIQVAATWWRSVVRGQAD